MKMFYQQFFFLATSIAFLFQATYATDIPGQYIVYYKEDADRIATNQRLFSSSESASSESVRVVYELEKGIVVAGVTDEQHQLLMQDKAVERVVPVSIFTSREVIALHCTDAKSSIGSLFTTGLLRDNRRRSEKPTQLGTRPH